ncbi:uncharacterized protein At4g19900 [Magnolia sinica]|uniref:uncharacterized protein At4g19900 n=1 Tax=Magnolia sinica TaxID=86752 RepID=UPI0026592E04|nr:uncharacterized protein At4g19900 [Magnolia sinica]
MLKPRRRPRIGGAHLCAAIAALLLLFSLAVLHTRLGSFRLSLGFLPSDDSFRNPNRQTESQSSDASEDTDAATSTVHLLADDEDLDKDDLNGGEDPIDELDAPDVETEVVDEEEDRILHAVGFEDGYRGGVEDSMKEKNSGVFWDHVMGVTRRRGSFDKLSMGAVDPLDGDQFGFYSRSSEDRSKSVFASDDQPLDEGVRMKLDAIRSVEDVLLLKAGRGNGASVLRDGWASWFEKKGDFLRRDRMLRSNLEVLNPLNNPILQDPDTPGVTGLTRGDKLMQKAIWKEIQKTPFGGSQQVQNTAMKISEKGSVGADKSEAFAKKRIERRTLDETVAANQMNVVMRGPPISFGEKQRELSKKLNFDDRSKIKLRLNKDVTFGGGLPSVQTAEMKMTGNGNVGGEISETIVKEMVGQRASDGTTVDGAEQKDRVRQDPPTHLRQKERDLSKKKLSLDVRSGIGLRHPIYADGKRWGYFPGLDSDLSFSKFMDQFFAHGKCSMRVFMVWNSPPWMYGVRHQRGMESLLYHDPDACVVVFSETIELDFFSGFVKNGFKIAVVMPNLDELLKDTPVHIFASAWHEWRKIPLYYIHYSELVRLAALYKYGGVYLDSDVIVLKPLRSLKNLIATEEQLAASSTLNGAVMAFEKYSPFIMECLKEFYSTYDDTRLRWNGADLLTRVSNRLASGRDGSDTQLGLKIESPVAFFPINSHNITRYFATPATQAERAQQDILFKKILDESLAFHFWNSLTSSIVPEPESLVERLLNRHCLRCLDVL